MPVDEERVGQSLDFEIRSRLCDAVSGDINLADLIDWLVVRTADVVPGAEGHQLAADAMLRLAEYTNGDRSEADVREELRSLASRVKENRRVSYGTSLVTHHRSVA